MTEGLYRVKFSALKSLLLAGALLLAGCAFARKVETDRNFASEFASEFASNSAPTSYQLNLQHLKQAQFESHPNYLAMTLNERTVLPIRQKLQSETSLRLMNRGEAHVTVITPPEFDILKSRISMLEIENIAIQNEIQDSDLSVLCLGKFENSEKLKAFFLVVLSKNLLKIRQEISELYQQRVGPGHQGQKFESRFEFLHFHPHITLSFTKRDLHEEGDHAVKDESSCFAQVFTL